MRIRGKRIHLLAAVMVAVAVGVVLALLVSQRVFLPMRDPQVAVTSQKNGPNAQITGKKIGKVGEHINKEIEPAPIISTEQPTPKKEFHVYDLVGKLRKSLLNGSYGRMPIKNLLDLTLNTYDHSRFEMQLALLLRKNESLPLLKQELRTSTDDRRYDLLMLVQGQLRWAETVPEILVLLNDVSCAERVRGRAATAAALFQVKQAVPAIRDLLENGKDMQARQWAAMALGLLRDIESRERVESLFNDLSPYAHATAAMVLGQLGSDTGQDVAVELSYDEKFDIRCRVAEALSYIGSPDSLARLREMEKSDPSPTVRSESSEYLGRAELEALDREAALAKLKELLAPGKEHPPRWAFVYLAEHFGPDAAHFLQQLADSPGPLQRAAVVALLEISSEVAMIPYMRGQRP